MDDFMLMIRSGKEIGNGDGVWKRMEMWHPSARRGGPLIGRGSDLDLDLDLGIMHVIPLYLR